jgi:hypothetical protein
MLQQPGWVSIEQCKGTLSWHKRLSFIPCRLYSPRTSQFCEAPKMMQYRQDCRVSDFPSYSSEKVDHISESTYLSRRMPSSGMLRRGTLVRTDFSEELSASISRVTRIGELRTTLAVTSNRCTLRRNTNTKPQILDISLPSVKCLDLPAVSVPSESGWTEPLNQVIKVRTS